MTISARILPLATALSVACGGEGDGGWEDDLGYVCVQVSDDLATLDITASSNNCARDHEGAEFTCTAQATGSDVAVSTATKAGSDPNDGCAGPLIAECDLAMPPGDDPLTITFAGVSKDLSRTAGDVVCVPDGGLETMLDSGSWW